MSFATQAKFSLSRMVLDVGCIGVGPLLFLINLSITTCSKSSITLVAWSKRWLSSLEGDGGADGVEMDHKDQTPNFAPQGNGLKIQAIE